MAALLVVATDGAMSPPRPCRARLRVQAQSVPQAGSTLPEFPATPLPCEKIDPFYLHCYFYVATLGGNVYQPRTGHSVVQKLAFGVKASP